MNDMNREHCIRSLTALSVGDAYGGNTPMRTEDGRWVRTWSDDTHMAVGLVRCLLRRYIVDQDELMEEFSRQFVEDPERGYGVGTAGKGRTQDTGVNYWGERVRTKIVWLPKMSAFEWILHLGLRLAVISGGLLGARYGYSPLCEMTMG